MRKMIFMLGALTLSGTAFAKKGAKGVADKKSGVRVKLTQNLYDIQNDWQAVDGDESDKTKTNSFNLLLGGGGRTEVTYLLGNGLELGVIGGVMQASQQFDGDDVGKGYTYDAGVTAAYNVKAGEMGKFFIQPMVGIGRTSYTPDGGDESLTKDLWFGGAAGLRVKLFKRVTFDPQLEYMQRNSSFFFDGDAIELPNEDGELTDDVEGKRSNMGIRWGLTVML